MLKRKRGNAFDEVKSASAGEKCPHIMQIFVLIFDCKATYDSVLVSRVKNCKCSFSIVKCRFIPTHNPQPLLYWRLFSSCGWCVGLKTASAVFQLSNADLTLHTIHSLFYIVDSLVAVVGV